VSALVAALVSALDLSAAGAAIGGVIRVSHHVIFSLVAKVNTFGNESGGLE
jgi:hypothetical protein